MKKSFYLVSALVLLYCASCDKGVTTMKGAFQMLSQTVNDGKKDSVYQSSQFKIYTDSHVMYVGIGADSSDYFGIGTYSVENGKVNETMFFTAGNATSNDKPTSYVLDIQKTDKGYKQVIREMQTDDGKFTVTEDYQNAGSATTSLLDGTWKETKLIIIAKGDTTVYTTGTQYKMYESGNFIFGSSFADSTGTKFTNVGYGTFEKVSDTQIKETIKVSTYRSIVGRTLNVEIKMIDATHFRQTIANGDGFNIEEYEKLTNK